MWKHCYFPTILWRQSHSCQTEFRWWKSIQQYSKGGWAFPHLLLLSRPMKGSSQELGAMLQWKVKFAKICILLDELVLSAFGIPPICSLTTYVLNILFLAVMLNLGGSWYYWNEGERLCSPTLCCTEALEPNMQRNWVWNLCDLCLYTKHTAGHNLLFYMLLFALMFSSSSKGVQLL